MDAGPHSYSGNIASNRKLMQECDEGDTLKFWTATMLDVGRHRRAYHSLI